MFKTKHVLAFGALSAYCFNHDCPLIIAMISIARLSNHDAHADFCFVLHRFTFCWLFSIGKPQNDGYPSSVLGGGERVIFHVLST